MMMMMDHHQHHQNHQHRHRYLGIGSRTHWIPASPMELSDDRGPTHLIRRPRFTSSSCINRKKRLMIVVNQTNSTSWSLNRTRSKSIRRFDCITPRASTRFRISDSPDNPSPLALIAERLNAVNGRRPNLRYRYRV